MSKATEIAAKGVGKAKAASAALGGLRGVFRKLAEEHGEVSVLLKRVAKSDDSKIRAEMFPKIREELLAHERTEMEVLYPMLRNLGGEGRELSDHHDEEAKEMEAMIGHLTELSFDAPEWQASFKQLAESVQHHASEEEKKIFPKAQQLLGEDATDEMEQTYLQRKQSVMKQLS